MGNTPVVVGKFQKAGYGFFLDVGRDITLADIIVCAFLVLLGGDLHCFQCLFRIKAPDPFHIGVGDDRGGMVADHRAGLACGERPERQFPTCVINVEERLDHVADQRRVEQSHQRMPAPERIPCREG